MAREFTYLCEFQPVTGLDGGWDIEESVQLAKVLKEKGVDLIDVSSGGGVSHQQIALGPITKFLCRKN
jgi:2,4-dienoyl-CoA reductase-like NADH-dependent reductase (Old Yellow Enzyme family)